MKKGTILLTCFSVFLGVLLVTQVRMPSGEKLYVSAKALDDLQIMIDGEKDSIKRTELQVVDAKKRLEEYQLAAEDGTDALIESARAEVDSYRMAAGLVAVKGAGIRITLTDGKRDLEEGEDLNNVLVHDFDIRAILNDLFTAGAEAVSINGKRVICTTSVTCAGSTILINGEHEPVPFVIRAIGDTGRLYTAMMGPGTYGREDLSSQITFDVKVEDEVYIPAFSGTISRQYMEITKEGETN